jgi:hypothetical protein
MFMNEAIAETLVIALAVIMLYNSSTVFTQRGFTKENHAIQARLFNCTDK